MDKAFLILRGGAALFLKYAAKAAPSDASYKRLVAADHHTLAAHPARVDDNKAAFLRDHRRPAYYLAIVAAALGLAEAAEFLAPA